jgi:hypothetical protein
VFLTTGIDPDGRSYANSLGNGLRRDDSDPGFFRLRNDTVAVSGVVNFIF